MSSDSWKAIPTFQPYAAAASTPGGVDTRQQRPVAARGRDQRRRLAPDDAQVVLDRRFELRHVRRQRTEGSLHLLDLPLAQGRERAGHDPGHLDPEVGRQLGGPGEQVVAGQDRDGVVPARVGGRRPPPGRRLVDHVVVVERREVDELHDHAGVDQLRAAGVPEVTREGHHQRAEAFAAGGDQVAGGLVDERVARGHLGVQLVLDGRERAGDRQPVRLELVEDRFGDREAGAARLPGRAAGGEGTGGGAHRASTPASVASRSSSSGWMPR
jgi:hypothetical protein